MKPSSAIAIAVKKVWREREPKMGIDPYLLPNRLQDVLAALQFMACHPDYDLTLDEFRKRIAFEPRSAKSWGGVFPDHPEFFRQSERGNDYSLVLRRARPKGEDRLRPPLVPSELTMLMDIAINLQRQALEMRRERRAWLPFLLTGTGIVGSLLGAILGAMIKGS